MLIKRKQHIFEWQVFGVAPTDIIHRIATNYILGPDCKPDDPEHGNFLRADTAKLAQEGKLAEWVDEKFGPKLAEAKRRKEDAS